MAHVDLRTGKIYGCKPGTLTWLHEKGHLYYNSRAWAARLEFSRSNFQDLGLFFVILGAVFRWPYFNYVALTCALGWAGLYFFEEAYAWVYAFKKFGTRKVSTNKRA